MRTKKDHMQNDFFCFQVISMLHNRIVVLKEYFFSVTEDMFVALLPETT